MTSKTSSELPDPPSAFSIDDTLSNELLKLSFNDRNEIDEEIHGVRCRAAYETPELIERSLAEFDSQLNRRKESDPMLKVLRNVTRISPGSEVSTKSGCYLNGPDLRLRFLRCERFVVVKAVQRFIDFFEFMSELFGDFVAERDVRHSDFNKEEETALMNSRNQYMPYRDRSGRRVLVGVGNCNFHLDIKLRFKILMYLFWIASEDVETQKKGVVIICWAFDETNNNT